MFVQKFLDDIKQGKHMLPDVSPEEWKEALEQSKKFPLNAPATIEVPLEELTLLLNEVNKFVKEAIHKKQIDEIFELALRCKNLLNKIKI